MARTLAENNNRVVLSLWALVSVIAEIIGITIFDPFNVVERQEIPYHRIASVRLSVFLTFAYSLV